MKTAVEPFLYAALLKIVGRLRDSHLSPSAYGFAGERLVLDLRAPATLSGMTDDLVPPFADDAFRRVLCVVAHPDDVEYGTSSAVASWTARGLDVAYLLLTRGEAGIDSSPPERTAQLRAEEQIAASQAVGVTDVEFLDHRDGMLEYGLGLRRDIARAIRRRKPDAVVAGSWEVEFGGGLNQADHRVAGLAALDALRDAGNRWVFPELLDEGLPPHSVRWLLLGGDPRPTHGVDVTGEPLERGIASLEAHKQYLAGLPGHPAPRMMITGFTAWQGRSMGVPHAVLFRAWDFQAPPPLAAEILAAAQDG
jgi:LmbE family N-acetylglucosaminyl deacetylase